MTIEPSDNLSGDNFLDATRQGGAHAWEMLVHEYRAYLGAVAARALNEPNRDCSSIVQDGLATAFERISQFRGKSKEELLAWLSRIVRNKAVDRRRARDASVVPLPPSVDDVLAASHSTPSSQAVRREQAARIIDAVQGLPVDYRNVIWWRIFEELPYDEIAAKMGRSNDAVRSLWVRGIKQLRDDLGEAK